MSYQVYQLEPGQCTCVLGDPMAGSRTVNVLRISGTGILIEPAFQLRANQFVYTSVKFRDGPALALSGFVVSSLQSGIFIRWSHGDPKETERVDRTIREYLLWSGKLVDEPPPRAPAVPAPAAAPAARPPRGAASAPAPKNSRAAADLTAAIRKKARKVRASDLASHLDTVQVLSLGTIESLLQETVDDSLALLGQNLKESENKKLLEEVEDDFKRRLEAFESEKADLEERAQILQGQLGKMKSLLEEERLKVIRTSQFTVSDAGMVELEQRLGRMLDYALRKGEVAKETESEMRSVVSRLLDDEREKIRQQVQQAQNDRISLLEKKVQRLAVSLESAEEERDRAQRRAQALEAAGGVPLRNIVEAGLDEEDPRKERKLALLKEVVRLNRDMREELAALGRLPQGRPPPLKKDEAGGGKEPPAGQRSEAPEEVLEMAT